MSRIGRMHANGAFGKAPARKPRGVVYEADNLAAAAARLPVEQWGDHFVIVVPRSDMNGDSNTGVVWKSPDSSVLGAVLSRPSASGDLVCHERTLLELIAAGPNPVNVEPPFESGRVYLVKPPAVDE